MAKGWISCGNNDLIWNENKQQRDKRRRKFENIIRHLDSPKLEDMLEHSNNLKTQEIIYEKQLLDNKDKIKSKKLLKQIKTIEKRNQKATEKKND